MAKQKAQQKLCHGFINKKVNKWYLQKVLKSTSLL
jgi:hypothetical protein